MRIKEIAKMVASPQISITIKRLGHIILIEGTGVSVTFYPNDKNMTYNAILAKCVELGSDLSIDKDDFDAKYERHNIDIQLTGIYKQYYEERETRQVSDAEHLVNLAASQITEQFIDQTGAYYAVIDRDDHREILNMDYQEFDLFLSQIFYTSENKVLSRDTANNVKRLLKSFTKDTRYLYDRIAKVGADTIYYDLNNENWQCIKITKKGWGIVDNPCIFKRPSNDGKQVFPIPANNTSQNRRYLKEEIFDKSTIKYEHQKLIAELYTISLFIPDIAHPMIIPIGPAASGKTLLLRLIKLIVDPRGEIEELVQRLPRDEKDRRVNIYGDYVSYFDNETALNNYEMDELCSWVTGYSGTVRVLHTTDESRTYSGKKIIGINGINIPVSNSDALNRTFVIEMEKVPDGSDGITESKLVPENEFIDNFRKLIPEILAYIFDVLVNALQIYDQVKKDVKSNHRLADFVIWGETISRVLGNENNAFLKAWQQNIETQNLTVIRNNSLAGLVISYAFNERAEIDFEIEPQDLLTALRTHAYAKGIDYDFDKYLPKNASWLSRQINNICNDLRVAGLVINPDMQKNNRRYIGFKKDIKQRRD
jgi:hypothetical protein